LPIITKLTLQRPSNGSQSQTIGLEVEFAASSGQSGARLILSAPIPNNQKMTIEDLQKRSFDILLDILRESFETTHSADTVRS